VRQFAGIDVTIVGVEELEAILARFEPKEAKKLLQKATQAGAKVLKPKVKAEAPNQRRLKRSISAKRAARALPAALVTPRPKIAFYRHWTINGTKPRQTAKGANRGQVAPNPFIKRAADRHQNEAYDAVNKVITDALEAP
jgi:hypothetical protein